MSGEYATIHMENVMESKNWDADSGPEFASNGDKGAAVPADGDVFPTPSHWWLLGLSGQGDSQRLAGKRNSCQSPVNTAGVTLKAWA